MAENATTEAPVPVQVVPDTPKPSPEDRIAAILQRDHGIENEPRQAVAEAEEEAAEEAPEEEAPEEAKEEAAEEAKAEGKDEANEPEDDGVAIETLSELAEHLGIEAAELYNLRVPITGPDGNKTEVTLGEWKDGFQANEKAAALQNELTAQKQAIEEERQQIKTTLHQQATEHAAMLDHMQQQLTREFQAVNWEQLRAENPVEWTAKRQEFTERQASIQAIRHEAAQKYDQIVRGHEAEMAQRKEKLIQREHGALVAAIPEWRDEEKGNAEKQKVAEYLLSRGYSEQEIGNAIDHRAIVLARKAMQWDAQQAAAKKAAKKVVKIGKRVLKPGARADKATAKQDQEKALRANLRKSGRTEDLAALLSFRKSR